MLVLSSIKDDRVNKIIDLTSVDYRHMLAAIAGNNFSDPAIRQLISESKMNGHQLYFFETDCTFEEVQRIADTSPCDLANLVKSNGSLL